MALVRPQVTVFDARNPAESCGSAVMPHVMAAPVRSDLTRFVHNKVSRNLMKPHGVKVGAGYESSAESWGTGRAVARIPRVAGGGTHRAGQGAFGNMCRGGGMFAPKKTWRRWQRRVNLTKRRHALVSAVAATAVPGLVMARGHKVDEVREFPIVVSDDIQDVLKTKTAKQILEKIGCGDDLRRAEESRRIRTGRGKLRNRRYTCRRGPLLIYANNNGCKEAFRTLPGVDLLNVEAMNLLKLAPGGTLGRLVVWTESAFNKLDKIFGSAASGTAALKDYTLPKSVMTNADLTRIVNSFEVQSEMRPAKRKAMKTGVAKNPLKNKAAMIRLNPAAQVLRKRIRLACKPGTSEHLFFAEKRRTEDAERIAAGAKVKKQTAEEYAALQKMIADSTTGDSAEDASTE